MDCYRFEHLVEHWRALCGITIVSRVRGRGAGDDVLVEVGRSERIIIEAPRLLIDRPIGRLDKCKSVQSFWFALQRNSSLDDDAAKLYCASLAVGRQSRNWPDFA